MSKQYGLIVPNKDKVQVQAPVARPSIFASDSDSEPETSLRPMTNQKVRQQDKITHSKALEEDPTVFQYDEVYDEIDKKRKESKLVRKDLDKKPKYINKLLEAAQRRKRENERRIERQVQREREAEGDEFKDKESYITTAYRKKLEEMKEMEEQEKREEYLEAIGDVTKQENLDGFYRHLYDQKVNYNDSDKEEAPENQPSPEIKTEKRSSDEEKEPKRKKRKYRARKNSDESDSEGEENHSASIQEIKKEHLPSNLDADSDFSIDSSDSEDANVEPEDQSKPEDEPVAIKVEPVETKESEVKKIEEQPKDEESPEKIVKKEPKKPKIDIWKKRTVGEAFDAALQRYYERKAAREL